MNATYTHLKDGSWGVRVQGQARDNQAITVTKKDGSTKSETISKVLWCGPDPRTKQTISLCAIARSPRQGLLTRRQAGGGSSNSGHYCRICRHTADECADMDCTCQACGGMQQ